MKQEEKCAVCGDTKPISKMRNVDTSDGTAEGAWIYACRSEHPQGLGGTCFGKYSRSLHLKNN